MHFSIIAVLAVLGSTLAAPSPKRNNVQVQARATIEARQPFNPYHSEHRFAETAALKKRASNHGRDAVPVEKRRVKKRGKTCGVKSAAAKAVVPTTSVSTMASATDYYVPSATESAWVEASSVASSSVVSASASSTLNIQEAAVHTSSSAAPTITSASSSAWSSSVAPSSSSAAPATTSAASSDVDWKTGGHATWYEQQGRAGACGDYNPDSSLIVAINGAHEDSYWTNYGEKSQYCGRWVEIVNTDNGRTVSAKVADVCPTCTGNGESIDLSIGAFSALGDLSAGVLPVKWRWA